MGQSSGFSYYFGKIFINTLLQSPTSFICLLVRRTGVVHFMFDYPENIGWLTGGTASIDQVERSVFYAVTAFPLFWVMKLLSFTWFHPLLALLMGHVFSNLLFPLAFNFVFFKVIHLKAAPS